MDWNPSAPNFRTMIWNTMWWISCLVCSNIKLDQQCLFRSFSLSKVDIPITQYFAWVGMSIQTSVFSTTPLLVLRLTCGLKCRMLVQEFIAKPSQSLFLTSHNLQNIFLPLMKAPIYISQSLPPCKSSALGRFTFKVLMNHHFSSIISQWAALWLFDQTVLSLEELSAEFISICLVQDYILLSKDLQILRYYHKSRYQAQVSAYLFICDYVTLQQEKEQPVCSIHMVSLFSKVRSFCYQSHVSLTCKLLFVLKLSHELHWRATGG